MKSEWRELNGGRKKLARVLDRAARAGLIAKANVLVNAWKRQMLLHHGGFKSGRFATGTALNAITRTDPLAVGRFGEYILNVGTSIRYHLFWELGHMNTITGKYERVETLRPAIQESVDEMKAAFARVFRRTLTEAYGSEGVR